MSSPGDFGFPCMLFGVPGPAPDVRVAFIPIPDTKVAVLARELGKHLAEPPPPVPPEVADTLRPHDVLGAPVVYPQFDYPGYPPLHAALQRFGQTAAMAQWIHRMTIEVATGRRGGVVQAVSLYLTGLDRDADNCAISACRGLRFGRDRHPLPVIPAGYEKILKESRPLGVQIFLQPLARIDPSIRCAFLALGAAFFGTLGVEEHRE
jgi:hypothetical protein